MAKETRRISYTPNICESGISDLLQRLKIKRKTGRPVSIRQEKWAIADFKKTSLRPLPE